jgi:predicted alpha-1,2-mannosidase
MFSESSDMPNAPIDVSGRIGQYSQGDEQCHHVAYLYDYAGAPFKTQAHVRQVMGQLYDNTPSGLCGNDDCGQMSAWYVLSAMGFYSVDPSSGVYVIGSPVLDQATIQLGSGKLFTIKAENNGPKNVYIQSATLNGEPFNHCWFSHDELEKGGNMVFQMGPQPNPNWAAALSARPPSVLPF